MYDSVPQHDVPQNNLIQRFLGQRFSAIVIEILLSIVISVAAGQAFDIFDRFQAPADEPTAALDMSPELVTSEQCRGLDCALTHQQLGRDALRQGDLDAALAHYEQARALGSASPQLHLALARDYAKLGMRRAAGVSFESFLELVGKSD